jgi:hypothetical protein
MVPFTLDTGPVTDRQEINVLRDPLRKIHNSPYFLCLPPPLIVG